MIIIIIIIIIITVMMRMRIIFTSIRTDHPLFGLTLLQVRDPERAAGSGGGEAAAARPDPGLDRRGRGVPGAYPNIIIIGLAVRTID